MPPPADAGLWVELAPAFRAFASVATQWRVTDGFSGRRYEGLDYGAARDGLALAGITVTPKLWADIQWIEAGATAALNGVQNDL